MYVLFHFFSTKLLKNYKFKTNFTCLNRSVFIGFPFFDLNSEKKRQKDCV